MGHFRRRIFGFLPDAEAGTPIKGLCRQLGFSEASSYLTLNKLGRLNVSVAKWLKNLESENMRLQYYAPLRPVVWPNI